MPDWYPKKTFGSLPEAMAARFGAREALVFEDQRETFAAFSAEVDRVARGLIWLGIQPGDHVALWLMNRPEWLHLMFALPKVGERFLGTVSEYNRAVKTEVSFDPNRKDGRSAAGLAVPKSNWANRLSEPPFEAWAVTCGITFTFGGLAIDGHARVLDTEDEPVPGLFAAGELVGGLFYFNYPGGSGLTAGAVFGRIAGRSAAESAAEPDS